MNNRMQNPFIVTGKYVSEEYFCDREKETAQLISNIGNWRNTVLVSPRRMGKSGLIEHAFSQQQMKSMYELFFIDIFDTMSLEDFVILFSKEIVSRLQSRGEKLIDRFIKVVTSLRVTISSDLITGLPYIELTMGDLCAPVKTLEQIFSFLETHNIPCVVAIDEFQQIAEYTDGWKVIAKLRTLVQQCKQTRFIFAGSNRRMMNKIFNSPSQPFFMSCTPLYLGPIDMDKYVTFCQKWFKSADREITEDCIKKVYNIYEGHTWYMQYIMNFLFENSHPGKLSDTSDIAVAITKVLDVFAQTFQDIFLQFSYKQRCLLKAISKDGIVSAPTSVAFVKRYNLASASAVQGALNPLLENETVSRTEEGYYITNRFFSQWLRQRY